MMPVELAAALGGAEVLPVGGAVGGAGEAGRFTENLEEDVAEGVALFPVVGQVACDAVEEVGGEMGGCESPRGWNSPCGTGC